MERVGQLLLILQKVRYTIHRYGDEKIFSPFLHLVRQVAEIMAKGEGKDWSRQEMGEKGGGVLEMGGGVMP